jgi:L-threonylcarbamoyladenylate synthase
MTTRWAARIASLASVSAWGGLSITTMSWSRARRSDLGGGAPAGDRREVEAGLPSPGAARYGGVPRRQAALRVDVDEGDVAPLPGPGDSEMRGQRRLAGATFCCAIVITRCPPFAPPSGVMLRCNNLGRAPRAGKRRRRFAAMLYRAASRRRIPPVPAIELSTGADGIEEAARLLRGGALVAFPTETVYGLGGDATSERAVAAIFAAKGRPRFNPLISHLAASEQPPSSLSSTGARAKSPRDSGGTVDPRPAAPPDCADCSPAPGSARWLCGFPPTRSPMRCWTPSAARSRRAPTARRVSPTAAHVRDKLGDRIAASSTADPAIGLDPPLPDLAGSRPPLLRHGDSRGNAGAAIGPIDRPPPDAAEAPRGPGMLESQCAPALPLRLDALTAVPGEALLAFGADAPRGFAEIRWLSRSGDLAEAAANLFAALRALDRREFSGIAVMPIPERGLGAAINDRLRRAAAPRE